MDDRPPLVRDGDASVPLHESQDFSELKRLSAAPLRTQPTFARWQGGCSQSELAPPPDWTAMPHPKDDLANVQVRLREMRQLLNEADEALLRGDARGVDRFLEQIWQTAQATLRGVVASS